MSVTDHEQCCIHAIVSGKVQGVWFRAFVREQASRHKVSGWAKNCPDGTVETLLCGAHHDVEQVLACLYQGPPLARVDNVSHSNVAWQELDSFTIA